ncbi:glycerate kinase [Protaetiibacter intestinalis]|uniref:Glycerate kinase n=1 Tax=Protaetiibacter intestinalis TaxID=2419774 RepID=A0A387B6A3_9MICO|nr:glycerate kinase [Protaetiibacter intestinalis]AYF99284.1 glycerate kinase [Protaetiibacter intestinalis]
MRVVIAPDKFKGSLWAPDVIRHLEIGLRAAAAEAGYPIDVIGVPVADGGEGTLDAAVAAGFERRTAVVTGPTGLPVTAAFAVRGDEAVIEMAAASGLHLLPDGILDPLGATSEGTGELIRAALDAGSRHITLAIGGSASTDGGTGVLRALGARFLDADESDIRPGGGALITLDKVDLSGLDARLGEAQIVLASDVDNPLLGPNGAATVFGPQKGASRFDISFLELALERYVNRLAAVIGPVAETAARGAGSGAAGGVGYAALVALHARRRPGVDIVLEFARLADLIVGADLVITGEGSLDEQSFAGKTPIGVARVAAHAGIPVIAVCGRTSLDNDALEYVGIQKAYSLTTLATTAADAITRAPELIEQTGRIIGQDIAHRLHPPPQAQPATRRRRWMPHRSNDRAM